MNEIITNDPEEIVEDELTLLKQRANLMGITYHPKIGVAKLKEKVNAKLNPDSSEKDPEPEKETKKSQDVKKAPAVKPVKKTPQKSIAQLKAETNMRMRKDANKLVRLQITCMNPDKRDWPGEIFSVSNAVIGTIKKYIPFNDQNGYHVPIVLYKQLRQREYMHRKRMKNAQGRWFIQSSLVKEFNIVVMDPLTNKEMSDLKIQQALNHSID